MKKFIAIILLTGFLLSLCACGNKQGVSVIEPETTEETVLSTEEQSVTTEAQSETETETETESTTEAETTTAKETTTKLDLSKLSTGYIKADSPGRKVNLYKSPSESLKKGAEVIDSLDDGAVIKIIEKVGNWYKIYAKGKTGYVTANNVTDKKSVAFTRGEFKDGVYYNEWANLKINSPESWLKETYNSAYENELFMTSPDGDTESIVLLADKGPVDLIFKSAFFGFGDDTIEDIKNESKTVLFAGEKYNVWEYEGSVNSGLFGLTSKRFVTRYYYREFDGYSIVISLLSSPENELDVYSSYISKIK